MSEQNGQINDEQSEQSAAQADQMPQTEAEVQGQMIPPMFFPKIEAAVKAVTPDIDWKKAFEGVSVYRPQ